MEVLRLEVELELQLLATSTASAKPYLNCICDHHPYPLQPAAMPHFLLKSSVFSLLFSVFVAVVVVFQELSQLCFPTILVTYFYFPRHFHRAAFHSIPFLFYMLSYLLLSL